MSRIGLALKVLFNGTFAKQVEEIGQAVAIEQQPDKPEPVVEIKAPARSDALTFLAALQREARAIDFFQEPIADYTDAQIGAAVRDVHRQTADVIERMFALRPLMNEAEGSRVQIPEQADPNRYRLTGDVAQPDSASAGQLMHHGWQATKCEIPEWSGNADDAHIVSPAEVEVA